MQAEPLFKDKKRFIEMADPLLEGNYPVKGLYQALAVAAMCLQQEASTRPLIGDVVTALEYLTISHNKSTLGMEESLPRSLSCASSEENVINETNEEKDAISSQQIEEEEEEEECHLSESKDEKDEVNHQGGSMELEQQHSDKVHS